MFGKNTVRRNRVYFSASNDFLMSWSIWPIRSSPSPSASTVRAPSTVSVSVALISEYDALSRR